VKASFMMSVKEKTILTGNFSTRCAAGFLAFSLVAGCAAYAGPTLTSLDHSQRETEKTFQPDEVFDSFEQAFRAPEKVKRLVLLKEDPEMKHLPARLGMLVNLEVLELACLEKLQDLPNELGRLRKLEELIIDNGNGCAMNISVPRSIGQLASLRVLRLYGALDPRGTGPGDTNGPTKNLPATLASLQRLEELDLGRNGIRFIPPQIASLRQLKKLGLDYNNVREVPAFVGNLSNLEELSLNSNGGVRLPQSLTRVKGLRVRMGNNKLTLRNQRLLRNRFPNIVFSFENEFDDDSANEEVGEPRPKTRRGRR
jgi:hypothetical protein